MSSQKINFLIPVYNAEKYLLTCLGSITKQFYLRDNIRIIIIDGGSTDKTVQIAKSFGAEVYFNIKRLAEYGIQRGMAEVEGGLVVIFAADNELVSYDWIKKVVDIFESDDAISAVWGRLVSGGNDSAINKYFGLIQSDPLNWFLNKNLDKYKAKADVYKDGCFIFNVNPEQPLVWGANGLVFRTERIKNTWMQEGYLGDNDAFQYMIEKGNNRVAYFSTPFVYHHHVANLKTWVNKWKRNYVEHFLEKRKTRNLNWVFTPNFRSRLMLWLIYSLLPVFSLIHSFYLAMRDKTFYWFYHPAVCFFQTIIYIYLTLFSREGTRLLRSLTSFKINIKS